MRTKRTADVNSKLVTTGSLPFWIFTTMVNISRETFFTNLSVGLNQVVLCMNAIEPNTLAWVHFPNYSFAFFPYVFLP